MEIDSNIRKFLTDLIVEKGQQPTEELIGELYPKLEEQLVMSVLKALPPDKQGDFQHEMEEGEMTPEQVQQYVVRYVPNYQQVFMDAFAEFRGGYLGS
ncbi:MAG: hypothetical protein ACD_65C00027G0001 [uncultured bacterium]|nr:MAG: hypothetical protein ACD_65C00027G0001 [uncultured bacterium]